MIDRNDPHAPFKGGHPELIYRTLERDVKAQNNPLLKASFNNIVHQGWRDEVFCLFCRPGSLSSFSVNEPGFSEFVRDFAQRHAIQIEFQEAVQAR